MSSHLLAKAIVVAWMGLAAMVVILTANRPLRRTGADAVILAVMLVALAVLTLVEL